MTTRNSYLNLAVKYRHRKLCSAATCQISTYGMINNYVETSRFY